MNPLEAALCALTGCKAVTMGSIARKMGIDMSRISIPTVEGSFGARALPDPSNLPVPPTRPRPPSPADPRGFQGVPGVKAGFQKIKMEIVVHGTSASQAQLDELLATTSKRCPVAALFDDAGVEMNVTIRAS